MTFVILLRNDTAKWVGGVTEDDDPFAFHQFETEEDAEKFAQIASWGKAWSYKIVEAPE